MAEEVGSGVRWSRHGGSFRGLVGGGQPTAAAASGTTSWTFVRKSKGGIQCRLWI